MTLVQHCDVNYCVYSHVTYRDVSYCVYSRVTYRDVSYCMSSHLTCYVSYCMSSHFTCYVSSKVKLYDTVGCDFTYYVCAVLQLRVCTLQPTKS